MKEKLKYLNPIQNMMVLALLVLLLILTTQTSAIAQDLTRAQIAVILGQAIHGSNFKPPAATGIFDDVSVNDRNADWIEQFYKDGITSGCGQNPLRYCPEEAENRTQMAVFLLRSKYGKNYTPPQATGIFDDVPITHWAADWIEQLYREKITSGCSASPLRYCPDSSVTGVQTALFTARIFGGPPASVAQTGQIESYAPGDDGDLQMGVQWPDPRFTDNGNGTASDHLTGLIWLKNADCFGEKHFNEALDAVDNLADGQCGLSDGSSAGDWRLPNVRELISLVDYGSGFPALPPGHPFMDTDWASALHWSSTAVAGDVGAGAWVVFTGGSGQAVLELIEHPYTQKVWPVRGGNGQSVQDHQNRMATLPYPFSTVVEYDTATSTFFGRIRVDGVNYLASIASSTGNMITLSKLPSFDGWFRGASALDINNQRFFFIASLEGKLYLCIVDITTGQIIKSLVLSHSVKNIEFDPLTKSLFGISHFGADKFVSIDLNTGKIIEISELTLIKGTGSGAFLEGNNFFFVGYWEGKYHVCVVDTKTGIMKELLGKSIGLNEYLVKSFKKNEDIKTLFTSGVQSCTAIAGYDSESDIGFMAHFTPNYKKIDKALFEIEKAIQEISNNRGLKYMKLFVVGGVRNNQDSINNLMTIYTQLIERYGINYDEITKFNTGISHTILIHNGETKIF